MVKPKTGRTKKLKNFVSKQVIVIVILTLVSFTSGYILHDLMGAISQKTKLLRPESEVPEICPCGCNMILDECGCETAQKIKSGTKPEVAEKPRVERVDVSVDDDPSKGSTDALVLIVEFSDFQCPFCKRFFENTLPLIEENYIKTGKVRFVYRDFPLGFHNWAQKAAEAAECADEQGKFWEYHDILFERQSEWSVGGIQKFKDYARDLGLDMKKFNECLDSGKYETEVKKDFQDGQKAGVSGTPTFFINGRMLVGAQQFSTFEEIINEELSKSER